MIEKKNLTGYHLKLIALITMLIDHIALVVIMPVYMASYRVTGSMQLSEALSDKIIVWVAENQNLVYMIYDTMRNIGRMAFPIYCFLLVEGFMHTRSVAKYAGRLAVFALISEIPFDFAMEGKWWALENSNVFFTLVLGLLAMWAVSYIEKFHVLWQEKQLNPILGRIVTIVAGLLVAVGLGNFAEKVLYSDYGLGGVVAILAMYLLRNQKEVAFAIGTLVLAIFCGSSEAFALFTLFFLQRYDGTRGKSMKYVFYAFYPAHLLILALICRLFVVK